MKALTMDSSTRVPFILGEQDIRVDASKMTPEEWLKILNEVLRFAKPQLKYLPCFKSFDEVSKESFIDLSPVEYVSFNSPDQRKKCVLLYLLGRKTGEEKIGLVGEIDLSSVPRFVFVESILLSNKGEFLLWNAEYETIVHGGSEGGMRLKYSLSNRLKTLSEQEVLELINTRADFPKTFFNKMYGKFKVACADMKKRLEDAESTREDLYDLMQRIRWPEN